MKKFLALCLLLAALAGCDKGPQDLKIRSNRADFGQLPQHTEAVHLFEFSNDGDLPLQIVELVDECPCTRSEIITKEVTPHGSGAIRTEVSTGSLEGVQKAKLLMKTNDPDQPYAEFFIDFEVYPELLVSPAEYDLGELKPGESASTVVTFKNMTDDDVTLTRFFAAVPDVLALVGSGPLGDGNVVTLAPGSQVRVTVTVTPGGGEGDYLRRVSFAAEGITPRSVPFILKGRYATEENGKEN